MDRRVKERLVGASILVALIVLIVPELLSGPAPPATGRPAASAPEPVRNVTVDLATSKAPQSASAAASDAAASSSAPPETQSAAAASADGTDNGAAGVVPLASTAASASPPPQPSSASQSPANLTSGNQSSPIRHAATPTSPGAPRVASSARLETAVPAPTIVTKPAAGGTWAVQLGSFASRVNADKLMRQVKAQGFPVYVVPGGAGSSLRYRVRVGPMADRGAATQTVATLKSLGHAASFVPPAR